MDANGTPSVALIDSGASYFLFQLIPFQNYSFDIFLGWGAESDPCKYILIYVYTYLFGTNELR